MAVNGIEGSQIRAATITDTQVAAANKDGASGTACLRTLGTGSAQSCAGNDSRLSDARTPTAHASTHKAGGSDALGFVLPNYLLNGGFAFSQRQAPATFTTIANDAYGPDRWRICGSASSRQYSRIDNASQPPVGQHGRYNGAIQTITNVGKVLMCQPLEGTDTVALCNASLTVTFQIVLCTEVSAATLRLGMIYLNNSGTMDVIPANIVPTTWGATGTDPTLGTNLAYSAPASVPTGANGTISGNALNCSVTTVPQLFAATFTLPATAKNLIPAIWTNATFPLSDAIYCSEADLHPGSAIQTWAPLPVVEELARLLRFCRKSTDIDIAVTHAPGAGNSNILRSYTPTTQYDYYSFGAPMRVAPTTTVYDGAGTAGKISVFTSGAWANAATGAPQLNGQNGIVIGASPPAGTFISYDFLCTAEL